MEPEVIGAIINAAAIITTGVITVVGNINPAKAKRRHKKGQSMGHANGRIPPLSNNNFSAFEFNLNDETRWFALFDSSKSLFFHLEKVLRKNKNGILFWIDIDGTDAINRIFGFEVGNQIIRTLMHIIENYLCQVQNIVPAKVKLLHAGARDEFFVFFETNKDSSRELSKFLCEQLVKVVSEFRWEQIVAGLYVTITIGLATNSNPEDTLQNARYSLNQAKQAGKNRVGSLIQEKNPYITISLEDS